MYSVVLMMALTSGGDAPALGHGCCGGCYGCWGGCYGCYGGCHGGHKHGCRGGCHGCHGCWGGCHGCQGCYGCHGCHGGHRKHGCCGCYGGCYGCYGCYGGCYGCFGGCMGCYGGFGAGAPGMVVPPVAPATQPAPAPAKKKTTSIEGAAPATLIVTVPAEARLSIDGEATTSTATQRVFVSPALNFGREYSYTLQAEFKKNGKQVTLSKEVAVKAGEEVRVNFDDETAAEIVSR